MKEHFIREPYRAEIIFKANHRCTSGNTMYHSRFKETIPLKLAAAK
jgi:hypothetical protein